MFNPRVFELKTWKTSLLYDFDRWWQMSYWKLLIFDELCHDPYSENWWCRAKWIHYMEIRCWMNNSFQQCCKDGLISVVVYWKFQKKKKSLIFFSKTFQGFCLIRSNLPHTKIWTSTVPADCYLWRWTWTVLPAVTEKHRSIKYKSVVNNSSMTWGGGCFQSFQSIQSFDIQLSHFNSNFTLQFKRGLRKYLICNDLSNFKTFTVYTQQAMQCAPARLPTRLLLCCIF